MITQGQPAVKWEKLSGISSQRAALG